VGIVFAFIFCVTNTEATMRSILRYLAIIVFLVVPATATGQTNESRTSVGDDRGGLTDHEKRDHRGNAGEGNPHARRGSSDRTAGFSKTSRDALSEIERVTKSSKSLEKIVSKMSDAKRTRILGIIEQTILELEDKKQTKAVRRELKYWRDMHKVVRSAK
jgi:hypothetical protein